MRFKGKVHKFGDDINTDYIISSRRKRDTLDLSILKNHIMEDIRSNFISEIRAGDFIAAGDNFGCGSAMEIAALVLKSAGISTILAKSFAKTFFRNGFNNGILLLEYNTDTISDGDQLDVELNIDNIIITNISKCSFTQIAPLSNILYELIEHNGLVGLINKKGSFDYLV